MLINEFCYCSRSMKITPHGRTLLQQCIDDDRWLPGLPHWLHSAGLASDTLRTWTDGSPQGIGPDYRVDGENFSAVLLNPLHTHVWAVWGHALSYCRMIFFFPGHFSRSGWQASGASEGNEQHWWFPLAAKTWPICILQHPNRQFPWPYGLRALLSAPFSLAVFVMPFHAVSFCFWIKLMKPLFTTLYDSVKKVIAFNSIPFQQLWGNIFVLKFVLLCQQVRNPAATNFLVPQTFRHVLDHMVLFSNLCFHFHGCHMILTSSWIFPLLLSAPIWHRLSLYSGISSEAISQFLNPYSVLVISSEQLMNDNFSTLR